MPAWKLEEIASRLDGDAAVLREQDVHVKRLERRLVAAQRTADARSDESSRSECTTEGVSVSAEASLSQTAREAARGRGRERAVRVASYGGDMSNLCSDP
jgi:hypothetical protein